MASETPELSLNEVRKQLELQAEALWGPGYVEEHGDLLELAASYVVNIGNSLPATETEPGFFQ